MIESWSDATNGEIRDDQGISLHNPDTDVFMKYTLAGAYDSNIALLLTVGNTRLATYQQMAETIRKIKRQGVTVVLSEQNLHFARLVADRAIIIESGRKRFDAPFAALDSRPEVKDQYLSV